MTRIQSFLILAFAALSFTFGACTSSTTVPDGVLAVNLRTGETRTFDDDASVPDGWASCAADMTCPAPYECDALDESACIVRTDCDPAHAEGAPDFPTTFVGCGTLECAPDACDPAPGAPAYMCDDGSLGGNIGRCIRSADAGACIWEFRECPAECTETECGPAPGAPSYMCEDGSWGGSGPCVRNPDGVCGWSFRDCPTTACSATDCGPAPGAEPRCSDGTGAATVCTAVEGVCAWQFECGGCGPDDCGAAPGADFMCPDGGSSASAVCEPSAAGVCGWQFLCPGE